MATGPYFDNRRGSWSVQWKDGAIWRRVVVVKRKPGWKPGDPKPKPPHDAKLALAEYTQKELKAAKQGSAWNQTVAAFLGEYLGQRKLDRRPATIKALERAIKEFTAWCDEHKAKKLFAVTPLLCQGYINHWREQGRGIAYVKLHKALLAPAWRRAARLNALTTNPWPAVEITGKHQPEKHPSWTPEEYQKILEHAAPWLTSVLVLGCHTGIRIKALMGLRWEHIEWAPVGSKDFGEVVVTPELDKAGFGYRVPMHAKTHDLLLRLQTEKGRGDHDFVLTNRKGEPLKSDSSSFCAIKKACERAGLKTPKSANHAMRRTFGRWAVLGHLTGEPVDLYTVSRWMGHHSIEMTQRYLDLDPGKSQESMRDKRQVS